MHRDSFMQANLMQIDCTQTDKRSNIAHLPGIRLEQYMNTARVSLCLAILLTWTLASPLASPVAAQMAVPGQTAVSSFPANGDPETDDIHTRSIFDNRNYMVRTDAGDGIGYLRGYQTLAAFQPVIAIPDELVFWMSPRGYVTFNSGSFAGNLGTGVRWLNPGTQRILGGGAWWDHDNNGSLNYDQLGGSLEWLGNYFDLRANAYIPTNQNQHLVSQGLNGNNVFFMNNIGVGQTTITNSALRGGDFEAGGALPYIGDIGLRTYAGGYYLQGPDSGGGIYGVRARAEALVTQDIWGTIAVSHDRAFGTSVTAAATFYLFTGNQPKFFGRIPMQTRLYQQQERQYRVAVQQSIENDTILALRAGGTGGSGGAVGTPIFVLHVDNTAPAGGNGTVEHPLNHLPTTTASNVDIVLVERGDGTSNNMNQGITLNNFERLLGAGVQHQFTDTLGTFTLPGFSAGSLPTITNTGGTAVTLASHNEVSGFNITSPALHGITGSNIVDFNINNVNVAGAGGAGVRLTNATGTGSISSSTFNGNSAEGIRVDNSAGGLLSLAVTNVQANRDLTGVELNATASAITATLNNVTADNEQDSGFELNASAGAATNVNIAGSAFGNNALNGLSFTTTTNATLNATIDNGTITGNTQNGVLFTNTDAQVATTLLGNVISSNGGFGIDVVSKGTGAFTNSFAYTIGGYATGQGNTINADHGAGISIDLLDQGTASGNIIGNKITNTVAGTTPFLGQGIELRLSGTSIASNSTVSFTGGTIDGNTITGNASSGILVFADQNTRLENLNIGTGTKGNIITNNTGDGITIDRANTAQVGDITPVSINNNTIQSNSGNGVLISAINSFDGVVNGFTMSNNNITNNAGAGVLLHVEADANMNVSIAGSTISHNGGDGIQTTELTGSPGDLRGIGGQWSANTITFNGGDGINLDAASSSATGILEIGSATLAAGGNTISNNTAHGIFISGPGTVDMGFNTLDSNATGGIYISARVENSFTIHDSIITNNGTASTTTDGGDGVQIVNNNNSGLTASDTLTNNTIRGNAGRGVNILNQNGGQLTVDLESNSISSNKLEGIYVVNTASAVQSANALSTAAMDASGSVLTSPRLTLTVNNNDVEGNGISSGTSVNGLVVRVGTSDGNYGIGQSGGFFSDGFGGIGATITNNTFHGNLGDDISFSSFVSTVAPIVTTGTWSTTQYAVTAYQGDPLARLDLSFHNNTFDSTGLNVGNVPGAFYNTADEFKQRDTAQTPPGPFASDAQDRNAERLGGRFGLAPNTPVIAPFNLYAGLGQSTFRLLDSSDGGATTTADVAAAGFLTDAAPYTSPFTSPNGVGIPGNPMLPFGWTFYNGTTPPTQPQ
jgi:hypothetical protein